MNGINTQACTCGVSVFSKVFNNNKPYYDNIKPYYLNISRSAKPF